MAPFLDHQPRSISRACERYRQRQRQRYDGGLSTEMSKTRSQREREIFHRRCRCLSRDAAAASEAHSTKCLSLSAEEMSICRPLTRHMSHHILSILQRCKFLLLLLLFLLLALRGKQVHTVLHHCATLIQHPQRERYEHHRDQAHDITHETSFSIRCAQVQHASAHRQPPRSVRATINATNPHAHAHAQ